MSHVARPLPTQDNTNTEKRGQTFMPRVGVEPTIPVFERTKTCHALDRVATIIGQTLNIVIYPLPEVKSFEQNQNCHQIPSKRNLVRNIQFANKMLPELGIISVQSKLMYVNF
jgi:hypothetical protein